MATAQTATSVFSARTWGVLVFSFLFVLLYLEHVTGWIQVMHYTVSPLFVGAVLVANLHQLRRLPPEVPLYAAFIVWAFTGLIVAANYGAFQKYFLRAALIMVLFGVTGLLVGLFGIAKQALTVHLVGVVLIIGYAVFSQGTLIKPEDLQEEERLSPVFSNPNHFAFCVVLATITLFWLWRRRSLALSALGAGLMVLFVLGILASASRKGFLMLVVFLGLWLFLSQSTRRNRLRLLVALVVFAVILVRAFDYVYNNTYMGKRLQKIQTLDDAMEDKRAHLYVEALYQTARHPVAGLGLGNFKVQSQLGAYTHSDYMEVLSTTGLVGFLLYYSMYYVLVRRIFRLRKMAASAEVIRITNVYLAALGALAVVYLFKDAVYNHHAAVFVGTMSGHTHFIERALKARAAARAAAPVGARGVGLLAAER